MKSGRHVLMAAAAAGIAAALSPLSAPAKAETGVAAAGFAGFALGALFPFAHGYQYHPTGHWYVRDTSGYRYPVAYYKWYPPAQGYIYVGPNWRYWYQNRNAVYAAPPYFVVPPKRYIYLPPVPHYGTGFYPQ